MERTPFAVIYNRFFRNKVTDDMYVELTPADTRKDIQGILLEALPGFEFPRQNLFDYTIAEKTIDEADLTEEDFLIHQNNDKCLIDDSAFNIVLTSEEINIITNLMLEIWLQRQITSIENTRMKYSGTDFKFTSQANHLSKLQSAQDNVRTRTHHLQRLYKRRTTDDSDGRYISNWTVLNKSVFDAD